MSDTDPAAPHVEVIVEIEPKPEAPADDTADEAPVAADPLPDADLDIPDDAAAAHRSPGRPPNLPAAGTDPEGAAGAADDHAGARLDPADRRGCHRERRCAGALPAEGFPAE